MPSFPAWRRVMMLAVLCGVRGGDGGGMGRAGGGGDVLRQIVTRRVGPGVSVGDREGVAGKPGSYGRWWGKCDGGGVSGGGFGDTIGE